MPRGEILSHALPLRFDLPEDHVLMVDSVEHLSRARSILMSSVLVGVDTESKPQFKKVKGAIRQVSLVQLACRDRCGKEYVLLLDCLALLPTDLEEMLACFLGEPSILKIGQGLRDDMRDLHKCFRMSCFESVRSVLEINTLARALTGSSEMLSLARLTDHFLHAGLSKAMQCSNWARRPLLPAQIEYAALDALVLLRLFDVISDELNFPEAIKSSLTGCERSCSDDCGWGRLPEQLPGSDSSYSCDESSEWCDWPLPIECPAAPSPLSLSQIQCPASPAPFCRSPVVASTTSPFHPSEKKLVSSTHTSIPSVLFDVKPLIADIVTLSNNALWKCDCGREFSAENALFSHLRAREASGETCKALNREQASAGVVHSSEFFVPRKDQTPVSSVQSGRLRQTVAAGNQCHVPTAVTSAGSECKKRDPGVFLETGNKKRRSRLHCQALDLA